MPQAGSRSPAFEYGAPLPRQLFRGISGTRRAGGAPRLGGARSLTAGLQTVALLAVGLLAVGCASAPPREERLTEDFRSAGIVEGELAEFLHAVAVQSEGFDPHGTPDFFFLLNDVGSDAPLAGLIEELEGRGLLDPRISARAQRAVGLGVRDEKLLLWVSGRYPRFWTAMALSSRGWWRRSSGVWHDGAATELTLYPGGLVRMETSLSPAGSGGQTRTSAREGRLTVLDLLARTSSETAALFYAVDPPLQGLPGGINLGALAPRDFMALLDRDHGLDLALQFGAEREARVILVTVRLISPRILQILHLEPGGNYSVTREDRTVHLTGISPTRGTWTVVADFFDPPGDEPLEEAER